MMNATHGPRLEAFRSDLGAPKFWVDRQIRKQSSSRWSTVVERLTAKIVLPGADLCWGWSAHASGAGYGQMDGVGAHRLSFYLATGEDPTAWFTCHRCDNPPCCRPDHLFLGTCADNTEDAARKGRMKGAPVYTDEQVEHVRSLYRDGMSGARIARLFGMSQQQANRLCSAQSRTKESVVPIWSRPGIHGTGMKLSFDQVQEIRTRYTTTGVTQRVLAREFNVDQGYISAIVNGKQRVSC